MLCYSGLYSHKIGLLWHCFFTHVGIVYGYIFLQILLFLASHVVSLFWGIVFPFHYQTFDTRGSLKYIHITIVAVGLLLPCIPVGITLGTGGYVPDGIPPLTCMPSNKAVTFYATVLPSTLLTSIGTTFMILIFWKLVKVRQ